MRDFVRSEQPPQLHIPLRNRSGLPGLLCMLACTTALLACGGCPPTNVAAVPPRSPDEALQRINENLGRVNEPIVAKGLCSFRFLDSSGRDRRFIGHPATVIFQPNRSLYYDIKNALGGSVARIGSNEQRFWLWIDIPDLRKLWWGTWGRMDEDAIRKLPVPPQDLLDALCLRPLPQTVEGGHRPVLRIETGDTRLLFMRLGDDGEPIGLREIVLEEKPPYQVREILDRTRDGRIAMRARISRYAAVGDGGPLLPRRYEVDWPLNKAEMRLDLDRVRLRADQPAFSEFPAEWNGEIVELDSTDAPASAAEAANESDGAAGPSPSDAGDSRP